jgi:hypothetical protein
VSRIRDRVGRAVTLGVALAGVLTGIALADAVTAGAPRTGCWVGPKTICGGNGGGPSHGVLLVVAGKVDGFYDGLPCLGSYIERIQLGPHRFKDIRLDYGIALTKPLRIDRSATFSYDGRAQRTAKHKAAAVVISVRGRFQGGYRTAVIALDVHYGSCGPMHLTLRRIG